MLSFFFSFRGFSLSESVRRIVEGNFNAVRIRNYNHSSENFIAQSSLEINFSSSDGQGAPEVSCSRELSLEKIVRAKVSNIFTVQRR